MSEKPQVLTLEQRMQRSFEETETLRLAQEEGTVVMVPASRDASRQIPEHEARLLHVDLIQKVNDPRLRRYVDKVITQSFYPTDFTQMEREGAFAGYDEVRIIHHPSDAPADAGNDGGNGSGDTGSGDTGSAGTRTPKQQLQDRYTELFGEAPGNHLTIQQLTEAITAREAELAAQ